MTNALELDRSVYDRIQQYCLQGDQLAEKQLFEDAFDAYNEAWKLVPEPQTDWEASTWILTAIGDVAFLGGALDQAKNAFDYVMHCPGALGNPFVHLRYGQVLFELGDKERAAQELIRAYMGEGEAIFQTEDPKYLEFLGTVAELSP